MSKYRAQPVIVDGHRFASKREAARYGELKLLMRGGAIRGLKLQEPFEIAINGVKCFTYKADFSYTENGKKIVEDVKGFKTPIYRLKKKCVEAAYKIQIQEI